MPSLGWARAYRSGDLVRYEAEGLIFQGRADEQVKLGGRRIELGEIDAALQSLPDVAGAAAAVQTTAAGNQILVGYLAAGRRPGHRSGGRAGAARRQPAGPADPAADRGRFAAHQDQRQGGPARAAVAAGGTGAADAEAAPLNLPDDAQPGSWSSGVPCWAAPCPASTPTSSPTAAAPWPPRSSSPPCASATPPSRWPTSTPHPGSGALIDAARQSLPEGGAGPAPERTVRRTARKSQVFQTLMGVPLHILVGMRWLTLPDGGQQSARRLRRVHAPRPRSPGGGWAPPGWSSSVPAGPDADLRRRRPPPAPQRGAGNVPAVRAGCTCGSGWPNRSRTWPAPSAWPAPPGCRYYARALGAKIGDDVQLHSLPPVTGLLSLGSGSNIEPEVDLSGWWIDGDSVHIGAIQDRPRRNGRGPQHPHARAPRSAPGRRWSRAPP